jgi:hypothetical protein
MGKRIRFAGTAPLTTNGWPKKHPPTVPLVYPAAKYLAAVDFPADGRPANRVNV